ncbi:restriction endonuclease-related protein [Paenibacillus tianjinensis]|uniref:REase associating with pPIWI RE domain-containing protein n=1 Tax=Paenibacillus tianjinensis TaxID=2810347 RepID=A0ABX7LDI9_9BACL|nr:hypothetical protein [Paenibacillus tianjinensis]QSF46190.1 hypothetical protein JRJ22_06150 [Paenibacillus tianjinensis]
MSDVEEILYYLIEGLEKWELSKDKIPESLQKGHRLFSRALMEQGSPPPADIVALLKILQKPPKEWGLPDAATLLSDKPLVIPYVGISAAARDFKLIYESPEEAHVKEVLAILQYCRNNTPQLDEQYRKIRMFLIKHPVVTLSEFLPFSLSLGEGELFKSVQNCYQNITLEASRYRKCPRCGWTLDYRNHQWRCGIEDICGQVESREQYLQDWNSKEPLFRLRFGIYRYTLLPGLVEVRARDNLVQSGYKVVMFPDVDRFDLEVEMGRYSIYFDMKDFSNPFSLAKFFNEQTVYQLQKYSQDEVYVVIPEYRRQRYPNYVFTVKRLLRTHANHIRIIDERDILRMLKEQEDW